MIRNGDIFWCDEDGEHRKVTKDDLKRNDYEKHVVVYFDGDYLPLWEGMKKSFDAS